MRVVSDHRHGEESKKTQFGVIFCKFQGFIFALFIFAIMAPVIHVGGQDDQLFSISFLQFNQLG